MPRKRKRTEDQHDETIQNQAFREKLRSLTQHVQKYPFVVTYNNLLWDHAVNCINTEAQSSFGFSTRRQNRTSFDFVLALMAQDLPKAFQAGEMIFGGRSSAAKHGTDLRWKAWKLCKWLVCVACLRDLDDLQMCSEQDVSLVAYVRERLRVPAGDAFNSTVRNLYDSIRVLSICKRVESVLDSWCKHPAALLPSQQSILVALGYIWARQQNRSLEPFAVFIVSEPSLLANLCDRDISQIAIDIAQHPSLEKILVWACSQSVQYGRLIDIIRGCLSEKKTDTSRLLTSRENEAGVTMRARPTSDHSADDAIQDGPSPEAAIVISQVDAAASNISGLCHELLGPSGDLVTSTLNIFLRKIVPKSEDEDLSSRRLIYALVMLSFFFEDRCIPITILQRVWCHQKRWNDNGQSIRCFPNESGINADIVDLFVIQTALQRSIRDLQLSGLLEEALETVIKFRDDPWRKELWSMLCKTCKQSWSDQASAILLHAVPRSEVLDRSYRTVAPLLARHLLHNSKNSKEIAPDRACALLSVLPFVSRDERTYILSTTHEMPEKPDFVGAWIARYRIADLSAEEVRGQINSLAGVTSRYNAQRGRALVACAERLMQIGEFAEALQLLNTWRPLNDQNTSKLELIAQSYIEITVIKSKRIQGDFTTAFQGGQFFYSGDMRRREIVLASNSYLVHENPKEAIQLLENNKVFFTSEVDHAEHCIHLAECQIWLPENSRRSEVEQSYRRLEIDYRRSGRNASQIQASMGFARVSQLDGELDTARSRWLLLLERLNTLNWTNTSFSAITHLSLAEVMLRLAEEDDAKQHLSAYQEIRKSEGGIRYWFAGMFVWEKYLKERLAKGGVTS